MNRLIIRWTFAFWTEAEQTEPPQYLFTLLERTDEDTAYLKAITLLGVKPEDRQHPVMMGDGEPYTPQH